MFKAFGPRLSCIALLATFGCHSGERSSDHVSSGEAAHKPQVDVVASNPGNTFRYCYSSNGSLGVELQHIASDDAGVQSRRWGFLQFEIPGTDNYVGYIFELPEDGPLQISSIVRHGFFARSMGDLDYLLSRLHLDDNSWADARELSSLAMVGMRALNDQRNAVNLNSRLFHCRSTLIVAIHTADEVDVPALLCSAPQRQVPADVASPIYLFNPPKGYLGGYEVPLKFADLQGDYPIVFVPTFSGISASRERYAYFPNEYAARYYLQQFKLYDYVLH